ncbi:unnamed protein product, partial [Mesorhabditis belari]|uniref:Metaxin-2 n=1 Tax=Mesorhabditis belari TaxID=2138241 RepID=A0AAF3FN99_9BILA
MATTSSSSTPHRHLISDLVASTLSMNADSEWIDALLFTPFLTEQALLYEYADCLAAQTFFRMAGLPYQLRQRPNVDFISPTGKVPFLKLNNVLVAEFTGIVDFVAQKGVKLSAHLTEVQLAEMMAHMSMIDLLLRNIEIYVVWRHDETFSKITSSRVASVFHWPLTVILPRLKRREMIGYLDDQDWATKSMDEVLEAADRAFRSLSSQLGSCEFLMGDKPTEADALLFGHLYSIMTTQLPCHDLQNLLKKYNNLLDFTTRVEREFFKR